MAWERKRKLTVICFVLAAVMFTGGLFSFAASAKAKNSDYEALIAQSSSKEALISAISLYPSREVGYAKLIDHYQRDFGDTESEEFTSVFESYKQSLVSGTENYSNLMFFIGKIYLTKYKASSTRESVSMAAVYFREVTVGENTKVAGFYVALDDFISNYIVGGEAGILGTKEATVDEVTRLTDTMLELQKSIQLYDEADRASLLIASNQIIFTFIDSLSSEIKERKETNAFLKAAESGKAQLENLQVSMETLERERQSAIGYAIELVMKIEGIGKEVIKGRQGMQIHPAQDRTLTNGEEKISPNVINDDSAIDKGNEESVIESDEDGIKLEL
jgi:hypothetical protein